MMDILRHDMSQLRTPFILIVFLSLMALPSIYAGVNINGLWNPYNNTGALGIAVVDMDNTSISQEVTANILASTSFNFTLATYDTAMTELDNGQVYSVIIIPDGFSQSINSIQSTTPYTTQMTFITNDKLNPVTTRLTEAGARTVVDQVNDNIVGTTGHEVASGIVDVASTASTYTVAAQSHLNDIPVNNTSIINTTDNYLTSINNQLSTLSSINTQDVYNWFHNPVELTTQHNNQVNNYGSSIAPFYVALSLWVGALLTLSILSVRTRIARSPRRTYFGKMLTFIVIAVGQAILMTLMVLILGVQYTSTGILFVTLLSLSVMFMVIIYSLVSLFGNVGKFIAIILLVFQVSATGGIFPVEVQSTIFQLISIYLPVTYAIEALREVIVSTNVSVLIYNLAIIAGMTTLVMTISIAFKNIVQSGLDMIRDITEHSELFD